jgi:hypothetical protein
VTLRGVRILTGAPRLQVDLREFVDPEHPAEPLSLQRAAQLLGVEPRVLLDALLRDRGWIPFLWRAHGRLGGVLHDDPPLAEQLRDLREEAGLVGERARSERANPPFHAWRLVVPTDEQIHQRGSPGWVPMVVLPAEGYQHLLEEERVRVRAVSRRPLVDRLRRQLSVIAGAAEAAENTIGLIADLVRLRAGAERDPSARGLQPDRAEPGRSVGPDLALLGALDALLNVQKLTNPTAHAGQMSRVASIKTAIAALKARFEVGFVTEPFFADFERAECRRWSDALLRHVREYDRRPLEPGPLRDRLPYPDGIPAEFDFIADVQEAFRDPVGISDILTPLHDGLAGAFRTLLRSPLAPTVIAEEVIPMIQRLSADVGQLPAAEDTSGLGDFKRRYLQLATVGTGEAPSRPGALLVAVAALVAPVFGNTPSPSSLCVAVVQLAAPIIAARALDQPGSRIDQLPRITAMLFRVVLRLTDADLNIGRQLRAYTVSEDLSRLRSIATSRLVRWGTLQDGLQSGRNTTFAVGILSLVALYNAFGQSPDPTSADAMRRWEMMVTSAGITTVVTGVHFIIKAFRLAASGVVTMTLSGLSALGSLISCVLGYLSLRDAIAADDHWAIALNALNLVGSGLSLAGFLILLGLDLFGTGTATAWTGVGAVLAVLGVIVSIAGLVMSLYQEATQSGTERLFRGALAHIHRPGGPYLAGVAGHRFHGEAADRTAVPGLYTDYQALTGAVDGRAFWDIARDFVRDLVIVGWGDEQVAMVTGASEGHVRDVRRAVEQEHELATQGAT